MKKRLGVTGPERLFIRIVGQQPGLTPREIARALRVHPSSVSVLIKRLEGRCLIARGTNPSDAKHLLSVDLLIDQGVDVLRRGRTSGPSWTRAAPRPP